MKSDLKNLRIFLKKAGYIEPSDTILLGNRWYHHTSSDNVDAILKHGLKTSQFPSKGSEDFVSEFTIPIYGTNPIFLTRDYSTFRDISDVTLSVDIDTKFLVADIPYLADFENTIYGNPLGSTIYWEFDEYEELTPEQLQPFLNEDGEIEIEDLLTPGHPAALAAINLTNTAACMYNIPPEKISIHKYDKNKNINKLAELKKFYHGSSKKLEPGDFILPPSLTGSLSERGRKKNLDKVFFTVDKGSAKIYAQRAKKSLGSKDIYIYEVDPIGDIEWLQTKNGTTVAMSDMARVIDIIDINS